MFEDRALFSSLSLEGEYTDWVYQWARDLGAGVNLDAIHVDNFGYIYATSVAGNSYVVDRDNNLTANPGALFADNFQLLAEVKGSMTHKYMIDVDSALYQIFHVWRYGVLIETEDITLIPLPFLRIQHIEISPNGRYIAAAIRRAVSLDDRFIVLWMGE